MVTFVHPRWGVFLATTKAGNHGSVQKKNGFCNLKQGVPLTAPSVQPFKRRIKSHPPFASIGRS